MAGSARSNSGRNSQPKSLSDRMAAWKRRSQSLGVSWRDVDAAILKAAIHAIIASDCAIMFAQARGGEGVMVKVYDEGAPASEFAADAIEMDELLTALVGAFGNSSEDTISAMRVSSESASLAAD